MPETAINDLGQLLLVTPVAIFNNSHSSFQELVVCHWMTNVSEARPNPVCDNYHRDCDQAMRNHQDIPVQRLARCPHLAKLKTEHTLGRLIPTAVLAIGAPSLLYVHISTQTITIDEIAPASFFTLRCIVSAAGSQACDSCSHIIQATYPEY